MIIDGANEIEVDLRANGDRLFLTREQLRDTLDWELKPEGLCRGDVCVPTQSHPDLVDPAGDPAGGEGDVDLAVFARVMDRAYAQDVGHGVAVLGESSMDRRTLAAEGTAPDFELPDLDGNPVALHDYEGKKRLLATWASWCGCRYDLPAWQALQAELPDLQVISISLDNTPDAAREFVDAADPDYPVLIDANHAVAEQYGLFNVPSVVWIDEDGKVARSPVIAPGDDTWREFTSVDSSVHHDQLRRWVATGEVPEDDTSVQDHMAGESPELQEARAERRLGAWLVRHGHDDAALAHFERAIGLAPLDFTIVRGSMPLRGQDPFGAEFFAFWEDWEAAGRPGGYSSADHVM
jgi:peroxiredoxin